MSHDFEHPPRLDNLVPLRQNIAQQQTAGWIPGKPVHVGLGCRVHADLSIPVADGISLAGDVHTPAVAGRYPAVLAFSAYSHQLQASGAPTGTNETGEPQLFTDRGYVHVMVSRRGMGRSQGDSVMFFNDTDVDDHVAVIEWCARQPWCDGNVLLFGASYFAVVQPLVATRRPPALRGFFGMGTDTDYFRHLLMFGGVPQTDFLTLWMGANFTEGMENLHVPPIVRAVLSQVLNSPLKALWAPAVQARISSVMDAFKKHTPAKKYRELFASLVFDGKTRATNPAPAGPAEQLDRIEVPFVLVQDTASFNVHQFGAYEIFQKAGTKANQKWLIMTPPEVALPVYRWHLEALAFFDHIVHGAENGYAQQARVRYQSDGTREGHYSSASDFPISGAQKLRFHLASAGIDSAMHALVDSAPAGGKNSWAAAPFGAVVPPGLDEVANPILAFEVTFSEDARLVGPITASLRFSSNEIDSHVIARLGRVAADGTYHRLSMGSIRPACRRVDVARSTLLEVAIDIDQPEPLVPGEPVTLRFSLTPRPVLVRKGERIRLELASRTDLLRSDMAHGAEQFEMQVPPYFSRNTIHFGPESFIEVERIVS